MLRPSSGDERDLHALETFDLTRCFPESGEGISRAAEKAQLTGYSFNLLDCKELIELRVESCAIADIVDNSDKVG
jgi:hypothetical protein